MKPKNIFEEKANFQQFLQAVKQSGFRNNAPSFEDSYKSLMATLLECATVANIQNQVIARRSSSVGGHDEKNEGTNEMNNIIAVPSEIMEEAAKVDMSKSEVLQKAMLGDIVSPQRVANSQEEVKEEEEEEEDVETEESLLAKKNALLNGSIKRVVQEPVVRKVEEVKPIPPPPAVVSFNNNNNKTIQTSSPMPSKRKTPPAVVNQPPKRNVKEIPQDEKDQMFNMCILFLVLILFLLWLIR